MTDKIIEARERALCWLKRTQSNGWCRCASADACLPTMREMFRDQAAATLAADRAAGYWLAPMEASEAMLKAAEADEDDWRFMPHPKDRYARHFNVMRDAFLPAPDNGGKLISPKPWVPKIGDGVIYCNSTHEFIIIGLDDKAAWIKWSDQRETTSLSDLTLICKEDSDANG